MNKVVASLEKKHRRKESSFIKNNLRKQIVPTDAAACKRHHGGRVNKAGKGKTAERR